jgi:hypothetical protein
VDSKAPTPPADFFPIAPDEFALSKFGGTITIDGVKLTTIDSTFPQFELHKEYLLFISRNSSGLAILGVGPNGVFRVKPQGSLTPLNGDPYPIKDDIQKRFAKSLDRVKSYARRPK